MPDSPHTPTAPRAIDVIRAKRDGEPLTREAIAAFVAGATDRTWPDYQLAALLMAIVWRGMSRDETAWLTAAMVASGTRVDLSGLPGTKVGKHSTGGVGDKVSIALAPLVAACGVTVPKMSGRGLGHTGGTLDKLEAIPGFRVALSLDEFTAALAEHGCAIISQTADVAPADKRLYALRDVTATVESLPLIASSVMSKKIAEGSDALVLDVKCGRGAFMKTFDDATALAEVLVDIGTAAGVRTEAFITAMDAPLGRAIGNAVEIAECVELLHGRGPAALETLIVTLAARMVAVGLAVDGDAATSRVREALTSGAAANRFAAMIARQGGDAGIVDDPSRLPQARRRVTLAADRSGVVTGLDALVLGRASMLLGAGRARAEDAVDPATGIVMTCGVGDQVRAGEPLADLHVNDERHLEDARRMALSAITLGDTAIAPSPLVLGRVAS